mmetsp:Transcript_67044/g.119054  ORF Transcript_67044/g.119054 Transcript_67044/m.119054 type:complete len:86 (+) Transcript_67044:316-573(+)
MSAAPALMTTNLPPFQSGDSGVVTGSMVSPRDLHIPTHTGTHARMRTHMHTRKSTLLHDMQRGNGHASTTGGGQTQEPEPVCHLK